MVGLAPGRESVIGSPGPLCGHTSRLCLFGECCSYSFCWICFLGWGARSSDDVSHFLGGTRRGRCSRTMVKGLEKCVSMGSIPGTTHWWWKIWWGDVLGRLWMVFFLGGSGEGKRNSRARTTEAFLQDDTSSKQPFLCYILSVEQWTRSSFDNLTTSSTHWRQWRVCRTSFRHGLHGTVGMVSYAHVVYFTCLGLRT
jgi:hypothetical protein